VLLMLIVASVLVLPRVVKWWRGRAIDAGTV
jgi:hypothetical protein